MNDATTSTIRDSASHHNDGTKKGANEPNQVAGKIGNAQNFDGSNDHIEIATSTDFDVTGSNTRTFSMWINADTWTTNGHIFTKWYYDDFGPGFATNFVSTSNPNGPAFYQFRDSGYTYWYGWETTKHFIWGLGIS